MPRPQKCRRICFTPQYDSFYPENSQTDDTITLTLDEYEVIRLVDLEKKTHEQCSAQMDVSRTTVTEIYESAKGGNIPAADNASATWPRQNTVFLFSIYNTTKEYVL